MNIKNTIKIYCNIKCLNNDQDYVYIQLVYKGLNLREDIGG